MGFRETYTHKILVFVAIILLIFMAFLSFKDSSNEKKLNDFNKVVNNYSEELDKIAFGEYEEKYRKVLNDVKEINRTEDFTKMNEIEGKLKELLNNVKKIAQSEVSNEYTNLLSINIDKLSDESKSEIEKVRTQILELINKGYYRVAHNEINILTEKVNSNLEEIIKIEKEAEEAKKKEEEEAKKKAEEESINNNKANNIDGDLSNNTDNTQNVNINNTESHVESDVGDNGDTDIENKNNNLNQ